jgi:parvulin-like peptidyl-prolyl isomerase
MNRIRNDIPRRSKGRTALLVVGVVVGALLIADGLVQRTTGDETAVALVNGYPISSQRFTIALQSVSPNPANVVTTEQRRAVLDSLIEEELLLQRGLDIGIADSDSVVRKSLVEAMIQRIVSAPKVTPDEAQLQQFYQQNQAYFTGSAALKVRRMVFRGDGGLARAEAAYTALAASSWDEVARLHADVDFIALPASFMPAAKLRNYLGPGVTAQLETMAVGEFSKPLPQAGSFNILQLVDLQAAAARPFEEVQSLVLREYQRREDDAALRSYLQALREESNVRIDDAFMARLNQP